MKTSILSSLTAVAALFGAGLAQAADFTFRVPVNLQSLHADVRSVHVGCQVFRAESGGGMPTIGSLPRSTTIADSGLVPVQLGRDRSYRGTVTVPITTASGANPAEAAGYQCGLVLNENTTQTGPLYEGQPGTTSVLIVRGSLR